MSRYRGEIAEYDKTDGNERPSDKVRPYVVEIKFDGGGEFYTRVTIGRRDYHFRALSVVELKNQIRQTFPTLGFSYSRDRAATLATDPTAILRG